MNRPTKDQAAIPGQPRQPAQDDKNLLPQEAETEEVAGRHKNDGRKNHQGTRTVDRGGRGQGNS